MTNWIKRKPTKLVTVGNVKVGDSNPISVQSMTNTNTCDVNGTINQINSLVAAGADIVRVSVPDKDSASAFKKIKKAVSIPLVADIHFDYMLAIEVADSADCLRINPGNIGKEKKVIEVINAAKHNGVPIRVGVNAGSLEKDLQKKYGEPNSDALVESAQRHIDILAKHDFDHYKMSLKASNIEMTVDAYRKISNLINQPLHLGITEAGSFRAGTVKSSIGVGMLLSEGIGDTIRISLSDNPVEEVKVGNEILKSLNLRERGVKIISCPSCARQGFEVIEVVKKLEKKLSHIKTPLTLSIIGCVVNGPGEAASADIGITGGGKDSNMLYLNGIQKEKLNNDEIISKVVALVEKKEKDIKNKI